MNLQIYKPNSKNSGCAISFQISHKSNNEPQFYVNCIAQHSWNEQTKSGSFAESRNDPSKTIAIKFNEFELGEIINAFQQKSSYSTFHSSESNKTQIKLAPYEKTKGSGEYVVKYIAYGLSFIRNGADTFKVPLEPGEAIRLIAFINKFYSLLDDSRKIPTKTEQVTPSAKRSSSPEQVAAAATKPKKPESVPVADSEEMDF
jgi:hypothetical protein